MSWQRGKVLTSKQNAPKLCLSSYNSTMESQRKTVAPFTMAENQPKHHHSGVGVALPFRLARRIAFSFLVAGYGFCSGRALVGLW